MKSAPKAEPANANNHLVFHNGRNTAAELELKKKNQNEFWKNYRQTKPKVDKTNSTGSVLERKRSELKQFMAEKYGEKEG